MKALSEHERVLLEHVREELRKEESGVAIYLDHLKAVVTRSGLPEAEIREIRQVMERIVQTNQRHMKVLDDLVKPVEQP